MKEEKIWEIGSNMDRISRKKFNKMVSRNLLYLVHARKHFGVYLDID